MTGSVLVLNRDVRPVLTANRECSSIRAPVVALADYLQTLRCPVGDGKHVSFETVKAYRAEPEDEAEYPAACVFPEGEASYSEDENLQQYADESLRVSESSVLLMASEVLQTLQVHVWTNEEAHRDQLLMMVEDAMDPVEWMGGFLLEMPHYHGGRALYASKQMTIEDNDGDNLRRFRKLAWRVQVRSPRYRLHEMAKINPLVSLEVRRGTR